MADHHAMPGRSGRVQSSHTQPYFLLLAMVAISWAAMYWLMYAMVDSPSNVYNSLNQFYMSGLMAASMIPIEFAVMRAMYTDRRWTMILLAVSVLIAGGSWTAIRLQAGISDRQFLRSMISHHASAILMCQQAPIQDAEVQALCRDIVSSQEREIATMKATLESLDSRGR